MKRVSSFPGLRRVLPILIVGLVIGTLESLTAISLATLVFSGSLAPFIAQGVGLLLIATVVHSLVMVLASSFPGVLAGVQDSAVAILAVIAATMVPSIAEGASSDAAFWTVAALIAVTSLLAGILFLVLGWFRLGSLARFVPYPVMGGFLAGVGWLVVQGALSTMAGSPLTLDTLSQFLTPALLAHWLPGALYGILLLVLLRRTSGFLVMPALLLLGLVLFYAWLWLTDTPVAVARSQGWLLGPFPSGGLWQPLTPAGLALVDWQAIAKQLDQVGSIVLISLIALLLNVSALEVATRRDVDMNRELRAAGLANVLAGICGGPVGYHTLSMTVAAQHTGATSRWLGVLVAALAALVLAFGAALLEFFPLPVLGGFLFFFGLSFLTEWLYDAWFQLPHIDYVLVLVILAIVVLVGFLPAVIVGLAIAVALFVVDYSRVAVVKHQLSGASYHSSVERSREQRQVLHQVGDAMLILELQGFLFFGTVHNLVKQLRVRLALSERSPLRFVLLDFRAVNGLDSSAVFSFIRMQQLVENQQVQILLTQVVPAIQRQLERGGLRTDGSVRIFPTLDHAVEWCEDCLLATAGVDLSDRTRPLATQIAPLVTDAALLPELLSYFEQLQLAAGSTLMRQGEHADALYFIESGAAVAQIELSNGQALRLRTMHSGSVIGEVGVYQGTARTATVVTVSPSTIYRLSAGAIQHMEQQSPAAAAALHRLVARLMAERVAELSQALAAVMK